MKKAIIILFFLMSCGANSKPKNIENIEGLLIRKILKSELQNKIDSPDQLSIDHYEEIFFVPYDSLSSRGLVSFLKERSENRKEVYIPSSPNTKEFIKEFVNPNFTSATKSFIFDPVYFQLREDPDEFLYSIHSIASKYEKSELENDRYTRIYLNYVSKNSNEKMTFYFLYDNKKNENFNPEGFVAWQPDSNSD